MARRRTKTASSSSKTKKTTTTARSRSKSQTTGSRTSSGQKRKSASKTTGSRKSAAGGRTAKTKNTSARKSSTSRGTSARRSPTKRTSTSRGATRSPRRTVELGSLQDVLLEQLKDLYSAEKQLVAALPKVARAAGRRDLREALEHHLDETRGHVERLDRIFGQLGERSTAEHCEGMEGLLREGEHVIEARGVAVAKDAALIAAAQRVEHYEIAAYGTARTLAAELGLDEAEDLLNQTLDEESNADKLLTSIATGGVFGTGINEEVPTR
jgi:ferritin-like metal-binding protein YciE